MSKILSTPIFHIEELLFHASSRIAELHRQANQARLGYEHPHLSIPEIKHVLLACLSQLYFPEYMQYSAHDSQIANMWQFLGFTDWDTVPYASSITFELHYDPLCIEVILRVTDELQQHLNDLHHCFGVRVSANGKPLSLDMPEHRLDQVPRQEEASKENKPNRAMQGEFVKYDHFIRIMTLRSYNEEGFAPEVVNRNCLKEYP